VMFGDLGQGAVLALAGAGLLRARSPALARFRDSGYLLLFCGLSAMAFGLLEGSVFGYEGWLPALWMHPLEDVMALFKLAVGIGIVCISIGIGINIVNKLRARRYFEGIFDKFGVIGILFYWGSLGLGLKAARAGTLSAGEILFVVVLPLALLFMREPLYNLLTRQRHLLHGDLFSYGLESAIEIMETVTTFLGSTVSFVRVGAFALSHAALCLAIYSVVDILRGVPGSGLWSLLVIVLGNVLVMLLEGMVVMIQGIRLQYYELFSKYFAGDGVLYAPFQIGPVEQTKEESKA
jgi:V/A-type H+/Na+-transporting ATPase subunit I